jgi:protein-disulfide isomerase
MARFNFLLALVPALLSASGHAQAPPTLGTAPTDSTPVAEVNGKPILYSEVTGAAREKLDELQHDYVTEYARVTLGAARARASRLEVTLQELLDKRVLELEAAHRKSTPEALQAAVKAAPVSEADERAFYEAERAQLGQPFDKVQSKIKEYLEQQATEAAQLQYLQSLHQKYRAQIDWVPLREDVEARGPQRGPSDAAVTIVEFSDFQCPFCRRLAPVLKQLSSAYPTQVRLIYRYFPLRSIHPDAGKAAEAASCADAQGKFWELHDLMYAEQSSLSVDALKEKARRLSLDSNAFESCLDSGAGLAAVKADEEAAAQLGLSSTPSTFVNGRFVAGALPLYRWRDLVEDELNRTAAKH